jgi:hypothetical protein
MLPIQAGSSEGETEIFEYNLVYQKASGAGLWETTRERRVKTPLDLSGVPVSGVSPAIQKASGAGIGKTMSEFASQVRSGDCRGKVMVAESPMKKDRAVRLSLIPTPFSAECRQEDRPSCQAADVETDQLGAGSATQKALDPSLGRTMSDSESGYRSFSPPQASLALESLANSPLAGSPPALRFIFRRNRIII